MRSPTASAPSTRRRAWRAILGAALAVSACHDVTAPDPATTPIAYSLVRNTSSNTGADIYVVAPDGTGARRLVEADSLAYLNAPSWSFDGRRLVYQRLVFREPGNTGSGAALSLWTVDASGSNRHRLPATFDGAYGAFWSPDGARVGFYGPAGLSVAKLDGSGVRVLAAVDAPEAAAQSWSPDGTRILYSNTSRDGDFALHTVAPDGSNDQRLPIAGCGRDGAWSPDGRRIAFVDCSVDGAGRITVVDVDGTGRSAATSEFGTASPTWSPDGSRIAYRARSDAIGNGNIHVVAAPGTAGASARPVDITIGVYSANAPSWRP